MKPAALRRVRRLVLAAALFAAWLHPLPAEACSGPCPRATLLPKNGAVVPQGFPGLLFTPSLQRPDAGLDLLTVTLKDAAGNVIPTTSSPVPPFASWRENLVVPVAPLVEGSYTVSFTTLCGGASTRTHSFSVGAAAPLPTEIGTLRAVRVEHVLVESDEECRGTNKATGARIEIVPTPAFAAFQSLATYQVRVDGQEWRGTPVNWDGVGHPEIYAPYDPLTVYARCAPAADYRGPRSGKHIVEVRARIAGATTDPAPASIEVDLDCEDDGGCSTVSSRSERPVALGVVIAVGLVCVRVRRRLFRSRVCIRSTDRADQG